MKAAGGILRGARNRALAITALSAVIVTLIIVAVVCGQDSSSAPPEPTPSATAEPTPAPTPSPTPVPPAVSPINGVLMTPAEFAALQQRAPLAVMIENDPAARPQFGLTRAELVYEAIAEGGITRFMAVFWRNDADSIAYLRSARIYYIQWAAELGAVYVHWGQVEDPGPVDVWPVFARLNMRTLNGLYMGEAVGYRDESRYAPHNVYTNTGLLHSSAQAQGFGGPPGLAPWLFKEDQPGRVGHNPASAIEVTFGSPGSDFAVQWDYDPATNGYLRSMGGVPHADGISGERVTARNVAVQFATLRPSGVKAYNIIDTVGTGSAVVFQDGVAVHGTWRKESESGRTRFFDTSGAEIAFNRGPTWIEVVPAESAVGYQ